MGSTYGAKSKPSEVSPDVTGVSNSFLYTKKICSDGGGEIQCENTGWRGVGMTEDMRNFCILFN